MSLRYMRLIDLLGKEGFERVRNTKVLLVGVGAIGAEIAKNLVTLGIKKLILVDRDYVAEPNLALSFIYDARDAKQKRKKAIAAAEKLEKDNPDVDIFPIPKPVEELDTEKFEDADIVVLAVDNDATRLWVNALFLDEAFDTYLIDCGAHGRRAEVTTVKPPETGCLRCVSLLKEAASHPCLPSHLFNPQKLMDFVELAKIHFYDEKNEILDPSNSNHVSWIVTEVKQRMSKSEEKNEKLKNEIRQLLKHPIRIYPPTFIRAAALVTDKIITLASLPREEIAQKENIFTQIKILGNYVNEEPVEKKPNCPQCGTGKISLLIEEGKRLQELIQKLKEEYGLVNPRVWKIDGELLFDAPQNLSKIEEKWVNDKLSKNIKSLDIQDGEVLLIQSELTGTLECEVSIKKAG